MMRWALQICLVVVALVGSAGESRASTCSFRNDVLSGCSSKHICSWVKSDIFQTYTERAVIEAKRRGISIVVKRSGLYSCGGTIAPSTPLRAAFIILSRNERKLVQTNLADLNYYKSSIDGLYGKGTAGALTEYNEAYLGNADLKKPANVTKLINAILAIKTEEVCTGRAETLGACSDAYICNIAAELYFGKKRWRVHNGSWSRVGRPRVAEAKKRGLSCGVGDDDTQAAPVKQECSASNVLACSAEALCKRATTQMDNSTKWQTHYGLPYVKEAKARGLSCGVVEAQTPPVKPAPVPQADDEPVSIPEPKIEPKKKRNLTKEFGLSLYGSFLHSEKVPNALFFFDDIERNDSFEFRKALRNHDADLIVLSSPGGSVWESLSIAGIINDKSLNTYVPKNSTAGDGDCASACSFMYFAGKNRTVNGALGVHQFYSSDDTKKAEVGDTQKSAQFTVSEIIGFLNEFETPPWVFERMFQQSEMYYFKESELVQLETETTELQQATYGRAEAFISELRTAFDEMED